MYILEGKLVPKKIRIGIVASRFNEFITSKLLFGVLTTENIEQAIERAGTKAGNKGYDCAAGAIEMVNLIHELRQRTADDSLSAMPPVQNANP